MKKTKQRRTTDLHLKMFYSLFLLEAYMNKAEISESFADLIRVVTTAILSGVDSAQ